MPASFWIAKRNFLKSRLGIHQCVLKRMCVTYFYQTEIRPVDGYWLVLANNRDEHWDRPTKAMDFWGERGDCISGQDDMPGKGGGTWLGMNCHGKLAVLLNILGQFDVNKKGRGHLVNDYLISNPDIQTYAKTVAAERDQYNGFNLVLFDLGHTVESLTHKPVYVSNVCDNYPSSVSSRTLPANTFHAVSNSPVEYPFQKVVKGKAKFRDIVTHYEALSQKNFLVEAIMEMLQDRTSLLPDPIIERAGASVGFTPVRTSQQSAINVYAPESQYGTTVSTVILVDGQGQVDYVERTTDFMAGQDPPVSTKHKTFNLNLMDQNDNDL